MDRTTTSGTPARVTPRSDRYQVVEKLGEGGMALVYRAVDNEQRRWCALKVLLPQYRDSAVVKMRFEAEAHAMARLRHRNLIEVWDVQVDADPPFFAMELATGGSVVDWINLHGAMPPRMAVDIVIQMCKALRVAHDEGLVHRDVKPHNILVTRRGVCKLTDFGIARHDDGAGLTQDGSGLGTLGYIAPEQKDEASRVDARADIYSLGATLHALVTGSTTLDLFLADQEPEMMEGVPTALHEAIQRATRYRPDDRYANVNDLAKALFQARSALPEDPPDTPSLVTAKSAEPDDRELERFVSLPAPAERADTLADEEQSGVYEGLARDTLIRTQAGTRAAAERRRLGTTTGWQAVVLGSMPLVVLFVLLAGITSARVQALDRSGEGVYAAQTELTYALAADAVIVQELVRLGADAAAVTGAWQHLQSTRGDTQVAAARAFLSLATSELARSEPPDGSPEIRTYREAEQRVRRLGEATEGLEHARAWEAALRGDVIGGLARPFAPQAP